MDKLSYGQVAAKKFVFISGISFVIGAVFFIAYRTLLNSESMSDAAARFIDHYVVIPLVLGSAICIVFSIVFITGSFILKKEIQKADSAGSAAIMLTKKSKGILSFSGMVMSATFVMTGIGYVTHKNMKAEFLMFPGTIISIALLIGLLGLAIMTVADKMSKNETAEIK